MPTGDERLEKHVKCAIGSIERLMTHADMARPDQVLQK
jgi:hypothetical protein